MESYLTAFNKQLYYFNQQLSDYTKLFANNSNFENNILTSLQQQVPGLQNYTAANLGINKSLALPANYNATIPNLQTNSSVAAAQKEILNTLVSNNNNFAATLKPDFQKVNELKKYSSLTAVGQNFKKNPYKTKRFIDRIEKSIDLRPGFNNYYKDITLSFYFQLGYKIDLKSTAGIGLSTLNSISKNGHFSTLSNTTGHVESYLFFDYWLFSVIHAYGQYKPLLYKPANSFENANKINSKTPANHDITVGIRLKPLATKSTSTNIYLLYTFPMHHAPYFEYRLGLNF